MYELAKNKKKIMFILKIMDGDLLFIKNIKNKNN